jgi:MoaA/NifB/PqqE/SkfB family radical SAM enzyme
MTESIEELKQRGIKFQYDIVNLHPTAFNEFTQPENAFVSSDQQIFDELERVKKKARKLGVKVSIPKPFDAKENKGICLTPWSRIQIMPSKKLPKEKWRGNAITSQCIAEAIGDFFSIGNIFEHDNFMEFWNNSHLVQIRKNMMQGIYPDPQCKLCYKYKKFGNLKNEL